MNTDDPKIYNGLTDEEVRDLVSRGLVNGEPDVKTKSYGRIIRDHSLTLFNLINVILLICVLITGSYKNALFFLVVIWNFLIGVYQEIRAKHTVEKLSLLTAPKAMVIRNGRQFEVNAKDLVLGDIVILRSGNQICADAVVLEGSCQTNESLITGESDAVSKKKDSELLSGSFVVSGKATARIIHVGTDNYVNKITAGAKYYKKPESVIMRSTRSIVRIIAICMIPLAVLIIWNNFFRLDLGFSPAMLKTVAAISSMIPSGLILLVSVVLAVSVVRLSMHKTLVQDLYCVENLARVDTLLLDKTGTITEGKLNVEKIEYLPDTDITETDRMLKLFFDCGEDDNATSEAIRRYIGKADHDNVSGTSGLSGENIIVPFSSEKKWSLINIPGTGTLVLGAPDIILGNEHPAVKAASAYTIRAKRVVMFAYSEKAPKRVKEDEYALPDEILPLCNIVISDKIRESAPEVFEYFRKEGVDIKVISGDSPKTVSVVARQAGVDGADKWVDASELSTYDEICDAVEKYNIFGRVTPSRKYDIVKALKEKGHTVAMTGDGANDVLALKEADCSVAMQAGADAARNVANMVLLDSDFSSLPGVVAEGRKSINNLQRSSSLYLTKTVYAFIFAIFFIIVSAITYPFENIHVTLIGAATIGIPSFFLALEPNDQRIKEKYLWNVFKIAVPSGVMEAAALIILLFAVTHDNILNEAQISTASVFLMLITGIITIFNICGRLNWLKAGLIVFLIIIASGAALLLGNIFSLVSIPGEIWKTILVISAVYFICHLLIIRAVIPAIEKFYDKKRSV